MQPQSFWGGRSFGGAGKPLQGRPEAAYSPGMSGLLGRITIFFGAWSCFAGWGMAPSYVEAKSADVSGPRLEILSTVQDFGEVRAGDEIRHRFPVKNTGDRPLVLAQGRTSCACSVRVDSQGVVAAGESGWIEVVLDTLRTRGEGSRTVEFSTNDPRWPDLVLALRGRVVPDVIADPEKLFFGRVPAGVARERSISLETAPGVSIRKVRRGSPRFRMRYERLLPPRSGIRLYVELKPQTDLGPFDDALIVTTEGGRSDTHLVPVLGVIEPAGSGLSAD